MFDKIYQAAKNVEIHVGLDDQKFARLQREIRHLNLEVCDNEFPYLTPAGKLAAEGYNNAVEMLRRLGASVNSIAKGYAYGINGNKADFYRYNYNASIDDIVQGYALRRQWYAVKDYIDILGASVNAVIEACFIRKEYEKVKEYQTSYDNAVSDEVIAKGHAIAGNHKEVEKYRQQYEKEYKKHEQEFAKYNVYAANWWYEKADDKRKDADTNKQTAYKNLQYIINTIVNTYAKVNNYRKVNEYLKNYENFIDIKEIITGYVLANNHAEVEKYRIEYGFDLNFMIDVYKLGGENAPPFFRAINKLEYYGKEGKSIIDAMCRLKGGEDSYFNPYWMNSGTKLNAIVAAVNKMDNRLTIGALLKDQQSELYQALNMRRLAPLTFLGRFGFNYAKTLMAVEDKVDSPTQKI